VALLFNKTECNSHKQRSNERAMVFLSANKTTIRKLIKFSDFPDGSVPNTLDNHQLDAKEGNLIAVRTLQSSF